MEVPILVALIAFGGSILGTATGGIIVTTSNYFLARMRERTEAERAANIQDMELHRVARLVAYELDQASAAARICVETGHRWSRDVDITTDAWQMHRGILAQRLSFADWSTFCVAILAAGNLRRVAKDLPDEIAKDTADRLVPILNDIDAGRVALALYVRDQPLAKD